MKRRLKRKKPLLHQKCQPQQKRFPWLLRHLLWTCRLLNPKLQQPWRKLPLKNQQKTQQPQNDVVGGPWVAGNTRRRDVIYKRRNIDCAFCVWAGVCD